MGSLPLPSEVGVIGEAPPVEEDIMDEKLV